VVGPLLSLYQQQRANHAVVTETLDRVLSAIPEAPGDDRILGVIRGQAERVRHG
jgi:hypothetical protein